MHPRHARHQPQKSLIPWEPAYPFFLKMWKQWCPHHSLLPSNSSLRNEKKGNTVHDLRSVYLLDVANSNFHTYVNIKAHSTLRLKRQYYHTQPKEALWCETCMRIWKSTIKYSITLYQHKMIVGRKVLKLIIQIWVNQNNMRRLLQFQ